jgi:hypothetical protein
MPMPLLLVDVDGPLNPWDVKPTQRPAGYDTYYQTYYDEMRGKHSKLRVWLNKSHGPMLEQWAKNNGFELAWATTWQHEANTWIGPKIGLTENWPVVEFDKADLRNPNYWKFKAVEKFAEDRSLVWLDDDFKAHKYAGEGFRLRRSRYANSSLYHVNPKVGLTAKDLEAVKVHVVTQWESKCHLHTK